MTNRSGKALFRFGDGAFDCGTRAHDKISSKLPHSSLRKISNKWRALGRKGLENKPRMRVNLFLQSRVSTLQELSKASGRV